MHQFPALPSSAGKNKVSSPASLPLNAVEYCEECLINICVKPADKGDDVVQLCLWLWIAAT